MPLPLHSKAIYRELSGNIIHRYLEMVILFRRVSCIRFLILGFLLHLHLSEHCRAQRGSDTFLIDCGASRSIADSGGRIFEPDHQFISSNDDDDDDGSFTSPTTNSSAGIFSSARIFTAPALSYTFRLRNLGRHWVRLYFYQSFDASWLSPSARKIRILELFKFSVSCNKLLLLNNISFHRDPETYILKEFLVDFVDSRVMVLEFRPANGSLAFVNAIEIVAAPDNVITEQAQRINFSVNETGLDSSVLETVARINMGGSNVDPAMDSMWRRWETDLNYPTVLATSTTVSVSSNMINYPSRITSPGMAPVTVYSTAEGLGNPDATGFVYNMTWEFPLDPEFSSYLVRMHFCDIVSTTPNSLFFNVYINSKAVLLNFDISSKAGGLLKPIYFDFLVNVSEGSGKLTIDVGPSQFPVRTTDALLNGLEIMKLLGPLGKIPNQRPLRRILRISFIVLACAAAAFAVGCLIYVKKIKKLRAEEKEEEKKKKATVLLRVDTQVPSHVSWPSSTSTRSISSVLVPESLGGQFIPYATIQEATNKFHASLIIGVGGFGKVYRGQFPDGTRVAVKRCNSRSSQGIAEFLTEIEMLTKLRHRHLVALIGYCQEYSEMILVYEFMANGSLRSHLYGSDLPPLSWKTRLEICIGAARGLHYLHTGSSRAIIHRDVKSTNILLDDKWHAKMADFGLSKACANVSESPVSTAVKGSFGYLDPEYYRRQKLTEKSDVYSFGVLLMEVLCARPVINPSLPKDQVNIVDWSLMWLEQGLPQKIVDPALDDDVDFASLRTFAEIAQKCLADQGDDRPNMATVLWTLEHALQLQKTAIQKRENDNKLTIEASQDSETQDDFGLDRPPEEWQGLQDTPSGIFSQLMNSVGR